MMVLHRTKLKNVGSLANNLFRNGKVYTYEILVTQRSFNTEMTIHSGTYISGSNSSDESCTMFRT